MLTFRIARKEYSLSLFPSGNPGRWNSKGCKVIYTAQSVELAFLEIMIRCQGEGFDDRFKIIVIEIPDDFEIFEIDYTKLSPHWRKPLNYGECQALGDAWYLDQNYPILKVPSAVIPQGFNYILNALHAEFKRVAIVETTDLIPDERIEEILKKYKP